MPEKTNTPHRVARPTTSTLIVVAIVAAAFFASGYSTSALLNEGRVQERSEARFREFLAVARDPAVVAQWRNRHGYRKQALVVLAGKEVVT